MSNLETMVKSVQDKKASAFKAAFNSELATRLANKLASMKQDLAQSMFTRKQDSE